MRWGRHRSADRRPAWKQATLTAFAKWLDALPDEEPPPDPASASAAPSVGLVDLVDAMAALSRETKALARASDQSRRGLEGLIEEARARREAEPAPVDRSAIEVELRTRVLDQGRKERDAVLLDLGDAYESVCAVRERLARQDEAGTPLRPVLDWFHRRPPPAPGDSAAAALDIPLRKLKDILSRNDVEAIARMGEPFDAKIMRAAAITDKGRVDPGAVSGVVRQGYRIQGKTLLPAEVTVEKETDA